jgi:mono/diheme cytochrome c family protein
MKRTALILILAAAACGGGKKSPAKPDMTSTEQASTGEASDKPAEPAVATKPEEAKPAEPAKPDESALAAAALTEQYEAGKKVFTEKKCASCHGDKGEGNKKTPPVIGEKALPEKAPKTAKLRKKVEFKTAADVMGFVKEKMPLKAPGTLTEDEAAAVTAWMLSESKVNLEKKLDASNAASVTVHAAAAEGPPAAEPAEPAKPATPAKKKK